MRARSVALLALILCTACSKRELPKSAGSYSFDMSVVGFDLPEQGAEIVYEDTVLAKVKPRAPTARLTLADDVYLAEAKGRLRLRVDGTCGKQDVPLRIPYADRAQEAKALRSGALPAEFEAENVTVAKVYYDNEGAPATQLTIGSLNIDVVAGDRRVITAIVGTCATARQVFVSGANVGELPPQSPAAQGPTAALVDLKGGRCYRRRLHAYASDGVKKKPEAPPKPLPRGVAPATLTDVQREDMVLKGQRIYAVGVVHDFLTLSPDKLMVFSDARLLQRMEIVHCEDAKGVKPPPDTKAIVATPAAPPPVIAKKPPTPVKKRKSL